MNKKDKIIIVIVTIFVLCVTVLGIYFYKPPTPTGSVKVGFSYQVHPDYIQFSDETAGNVTKWHWDFGDGNTSTLQNPTHQFSSLHQVYNVTLTVVDVNGLESSISQSITI